MTNVAQFMERSFDAGQVVITYAETGGSGTPLLLLHGATLTWHSFDDFFPTLSESWPIYACNLRGHGGSGWAHSGYRIGDFASDISSFLANRIGQPAILIGYSLGAVVAIQVAATLPRLVTAAIFIEPGLALRELAFADAVDAELYDYVTWVSDTIKSNPPTEQIMRRWLERAEADGRDPPPAIEEARTETAALKALDPRCVDDLLQDRTNEGFDVEEALSKISCPTLLLCGEPQLGALVRDSDLELFKSTVADGAAIRITGAGHGIDRDQPGQAVRGHIVSFLETLRDGSLSPRLTDPAATGSSDLTPT